MSASGGTGGRIGRAVELVLVVAASLVFVLLWVYAALDVLTDSSLPADTWAWLSGLPLIPAIVVWLAILPLGVYLWAAQAGLDHIWLGLVVVGLVAWTWIAWSGLVRVMWRRATAAG